MTQKIWDFIEKHKNELFFVFITIASMIARTIVIDNAVNDYNRFLEPWFYELKNNGGISALKMNIGNYNMPYLTILAVLTYIPLPPLLSIKLVSIIFDYICAFTVFKIVKIILKDNKNRDFIGLLFYAIVLFLPTVILNSAYWGQSDTIYTAFVLLAILELIKNRNIKAFIFLGIAFSIKLQFIFILPLFIFLFISNREIKWYYFLIIPLVNFIMCLPAIIVGRPIGDLIAIYSDQTKIYENYLSLNFPNIYFLLFPATGTLVLAPNNSVGELGKIVTLVVFAVMAFMILYKKVKFDNQKIIEFGLWSVMVATFILPQMHERYLFIADILSVLYYIYNRDKIYVPIGISFISLYGYMRYLFGMTNIPAEYVSFGFLILIIIITKDLYNKYLKLDKNDVEKNIVI